MEMSVLDAWGADGCHFYCRRCAFKEDIYDAEFALSKLVLLPVNWTMPYWDFVCIQGRIQEFEKGGRNFPSLLLPSLTRKSNFGVFGAQERHLMARI